MPVRDRRTDIGLDGLEATDVRTGRLVALSSLAGVHLVSLIRHRF